MTRESGDDPRVAARREAHREATADADVPAPEKRGVDEHVDHRASRDHPQRARGYAGSPWPYVLGALIIAIAILILIRL